MQYDDKANTATAAGLLFERWSDKVVTESIARTLTDIAPYEPGQFYKRELPCIAAILSEIDKHLDAIIVDGHAWLEPGVPGLGTYLFEAIGQSVPVVGVAKTAFKGSPTAVKVLRGESTSPLYVTAVGMDHDLAADHIRSMAGQWRIPTLLKQVDKLARQGNRT